MKIKLFLTIVVALILACAITAMAATRNPSPASPGYTPVVVPIMGNYTGATIKPGVVKFKAPAGFQVVGASATARAATGTNPTCKLRGKSGVYTNYSGTINVGTTKELAVTTNRITDEVDHQIDIVVGGTSTPTWKDITLMLFLKRL